MPVQFQAKQEDGYTRIISKGVLTTLDELIEYSSFMYEQAILMGFKKILLDEKGLEDNADIGTIYEWCEHVNVAKIATSGIRIAGLSKLENTEYNKMYETMLLNRSFHFNFFHDEEQAIEWLKSERPVDLSQRDVSRLKAASIETLNQDSPETVAAKPVCKENETSYTLTVKVHDEYIRIEAVGDIRSLEKAICFGDEVILLGRKNDKRKFLIIQRDLRIHLDYHDKTLLAQAMETRGYYRQGYRSANVYQPDNDDGPKQYETIAATRSHVFHAFTNEKKALDWLIKA